MTSLDTLPPNHPDRNRPLAGCWYKYKTAKLWSEITPTFKIARVTYNDLGNAWTQYDIFSWVPEEKK